MFQIRKLRTFYLTVTLQIALVFLFGNPAQAKDKAAYLYQWTPMLAEAVQTLTASPCLASRNLAIIYTAAFEAANAPQPRYHSYLGDLPPAGGEIDAVIASLSALSFASKTLFPNQSGRFSELKTKQFAALSPDVESDIWIRSVKFGEAVAKQMLDERSGDGSTSPLTYYPKDEIGKWKRTPPSYRPPELSYWANTRPFGMKTADQFRLPPPLPLDSSEYAKELNSVKEMGAKNSKTRTPEQTEIAKFWSCFSYTSTPAGHWFEIATEAARKNQMDFLDSARMLAILNLSMADAGIACWDTKYTYEFWRPIQAIRLADKDGNPETQPDPTWNSLLEAPPHPEYISGHGAFSGAGGRIMQHIFEKDEPYRFTTTSISLPGVVRSYASIQACTDEIGVSRLYGGIHFQYSNLRGLEQGEKVADYLYERLLLPIQ